MQITRKYHQKFMNRLLVLYFQCIRLLGPTLLTTKDEEMGKGVGPARGVPLNDEADGP
jgi:hypothetical protein